MNNLEEYRNLIGGQICAAASGRLLDSVNPATGEVWARVPASDAVDINAAVEAARQAQPTWAALPAAARSQYLKQVSQIFIKHGEELARLETLDNGKLASENKSRAGVGMALVWERAAGATLEGVTGRSVILDPTKLGFTLREPYGVVAAIIPWNNPLLFLANKAAAALAAGNTVVVKSPEQASAAMLRVGELIADILPPGVISIVCGLGSEAGEALVRHPFVGKITMTGSSETGRRIQRAAADTLTPAIFELGGKSPNIVLDDADLAAAAIGVTTGSIYTGNAGQICVAGSRILVQRKVLDDLIDRMKSIVGKIVLGDPFSDATTMGPIVSQTQFDRVTGYIADGRREAKLVFGGRSGSELVPGMPGGYWVEPTLFMTENNALNICQEEIFGPVAVIIPFDTDDEAIAIANDSKYGLAAGVWTRDLARAHRFVRDIAAGSIWVNIYRQPRYELPFGGFKDSGYGHDELLEFTREKAAIIAS